MSHIEKRTLQDGKTSWLIMFRYTDWQGKRRQKKASGFPTKREALAYERDFIEREAGSPSMTFGNLWAVYKKDFKHRVKESSVHSVIPNVERRVLPYFKDMPINQITPAIVRRWETELHDSTELSDRFIQYLHGRLSSVLSFACKYYSLPRNPAKIAGTTVKSAPAQQTIQFWTVEQFKAFDRAAEGEEPYRTLFRLLFWSGLRVVKRSPSPSKTLTCKLARSPCPRHTTATTPRTRSPRQRRRTATARYPYRPSYAKP